MNTIGYPRGVRRQQLPQKNSLRKKYEIARAGLLKAREDKNVGSTGLAQLSESLAGKLNIPAEDVSVPGLFRQLGNYKERLTQLGDRTYNIPCVGVTPK